MNFMSFLHERRAKGIISSMLFEKEYHKKYKKISSKVAERVKNLKIKKLHVFSSVNTKNAVLQREIKFHYYYLRK